MNLEILKEKTRKTVAKFTDKDLIEFWEVGLNKYIKENHITMRCIVFEELEKRFYNEVSQWVDEEIEQGKELSIRKFITI